ncbi:Mitochondrial inner membrane protein oxa1 [Myotisia sp. PD_48]|nr:Mitochondrial inner membrane protein oxa1 [Myotisia sp. PD_48]
MLAGKGLMRSGTVACHSSSRAAASISARRQFSSLGVRNNVHIRSGLLIGWNITPLRSNYPPRSSFPSKASTRFASSSTTTNSSLPSASAPTDAATSTNALTSTDALGDQLADIDLSRIPEQMGYLKELGLDYGWGPSSLVQTLLETLHIYGGLPWWGSAIAIAVIIRAILFKSMIGASDTSVKLQQLKPRLTPIRERMLHCARESDNIGALQAKQELASIHREEGLKPWKAMVPLLQIPFGFACFRVLRGMANLPVPTLDNEAFLWITDLTIPDPLFILPVATGGMMYLAFMRGGDTGSSNIKDTPMGKIMLYVFPPATAVTMAFMPAILQAYFITTGIISCSQAFLFTNPSFRNLVGMAQIPKASTGPSEPISRIRTITTTATPSNAVETPAPKISAIDRVIDGAKSTFNDTVKEARDKMESLTGDKPEADGAKPRLTKKELENAAAYEERRRAELRAERDLKNQQLRAEFLKKRKSTSTIKQE